MTASTFIRRVAVINAVTAVTTTPLLVLLAYDANSAAISAAIGMLLSVLLMLVSLLARLVEWRVAVARERARRWTAPTFGRDDAHALGLPWFGADGVVEHPPAPRPTAEQVHAGLHARRLAAQPEVVHVPGVGWTFRHPL